MATLEMVRLRSMYPNTGRMTVRHAMPRIYGPLDGPVQDDLDAALAEVLSGPVTTDSTTPDDGTTSQVEQAEQVLVETAAGKGGSPR